MLWEMPEPAPLLGFLHNTDYADHAFGCQNQPKVGIGSRAASCASLQRIELWNSEFSDQKTFFTAFRGRLLIVYAVGKSLKTTPRLRLRAGACNVMIRTGGINAETCISKGTRHARGTRDEFAYPTKAPKGYARGHPPT